MTQTNDKDSDFSLLCDVVRALDAKKSADLRVLKVSEQSSITDYLVLATGTSEPHLRALRVELEKVLDARHARIAGMDTGEQGSGWIVVDAYQIMIHLFTAEKRSAYGLENLWKDAVDLPVDELLAPSAAPKAKGRTRKPAPKTRKSVAAKPGAKKPAVRKKPTAKKKSEPEAEA